MSGVSAILRYSYKEMFQRLRTYDINRRCTTTLICLLTIIWRYLDWMRGNLGSTYRDQVSSAAVIGEHRHCFKSCLSQSQSTGVWNNPFDSTTSKWPATSCNRLGILLQKVMRTNRIQRRLVGETGLSRSSCLSLLRVESFLQPVFLSWSLTRCSHVSEVYAYRYQTISEQSMSYWFTRSSFHFAQGVTHVQDLLGFVSPYLISQV